jgi:hypothetical protein
VEEALPLQLHDMDAAILKHQWLIQNIGECSFTDNISHFTNVFVVLITIPILNNILYPFLREYLPSMMKRLGVGSALLFLSVFSMVIISAVGSRRISEQNDIQCMFAANFSNTAVLKEYSYSEVPGSFIAIPQVFITLAEILIHVTSTFLH